MGALEGRVAVITGGISGLGRASAERYAKEGAKIVIADVNTERGEKAAAEMSAGGAPIEFIHVDVTSEASQQALFDDVVRRYGRLDTVLAAAGVSSANYVSGEVADMNDEDPEGYYYLAEFYVTQNKIFQATNYFEKAIVRLSADLGYYISNYDEVSTSETLIESYSGAWLYQTIITISDIYLRRAEVYKNVEAIELMCEDYKNACDFGDCDMFNENCK